MNLTKQIHFAPARLQRGVALVVTLVLLSVITFLAVAFLFLARREKGASSQAVAATVARRSAETGTENAIAQAMSRIVASGNQYHYDLMVSTNFINTNGFDPNNPVRVRLTNVNYYYANGNLVQGGQFNGFDFEQNIANLFYSPRPPVFITTNRGSPAEFRYFWDLNRNGYFETNGLWAEISSDPSYPYFDTNGTPVATYDPANSIKQFFKGDPEFVGVLQRPDRPHSSSNLFVGRYAWILVPSGKTMDVNTIHNQSKLPATVTDEGFSRNMGFGPWELNLASFLVDLNTNLWNFDADNLLRGGYKPINYQYNNNPGAFSTGTAFQDALSITLYRNSGSWANLRSVSTLFGAVGANAFRNDMADGYGRGPFYVNTAQPTVDGDLTLNNVVYGWPGDDNPNHFFTTQDLFDTTKVGVGFPARLRSGGYGMSSYNRYTYYRLLEQLSTDSAPEPDGKMHLNYVNVDNRGKTVVNAQTNFTPWTALQFFTNAVDRILAATYDSPNDNLTNFNVHARISLTNIPVWVSNRFVYTPGLHRCLQLAANLYDASVPHLDGTLTNYPTVFRPYFRTVNNNIYIDGFTEVQRVDPVLGLNDPQLSTMVDLNVLPGALPANANIYGVPWVIGARKGFPSFNEFAMQTVSQISRKLQIRKPAADRAPNATNQLFIVGVSNMFAFEAWNPYPAAFDRNVRIHVANTLALSLRYTNDVELDRTRAGAEPTWTARVEARTNIGPNYAVKMWQGIGNDVAVPNKYSFVVPLSTNIMYLPDKYYRSSSGVPRFTTNLTTDGINLFRGFEQTGLFPQPDFHFAVSNRIQFLMMDEATGRVLDYVQLNDLNGVRSLNSELANVFEIPVGGSGVAVSDWLQFWRTNRLNATSLRSPPGGVLSQIQASLGAITVANWANVGEWRGGVASKDAEIQGFRRFMIAPYTGNSETVMQVPFTPIRKRSQYMTWQANDPFVHFTAGDLVTSGAGTGVREEQPNGVIQPLPNIAKLNNRFEPWGGKPNSSSPASQTSVNPYDPAAKDPGVLAPNYWDFPTNKFPGLGSIGRVHRGTPWQTVYMKSAEVSLGSWALWTGNTNGSDAKYTLPAMDRVLFDIFTTAVDQNTTRGQVNVNQTNLATWSALLGGVIGLTNTTPDSDLTQQYPVLRFEPVVIDPAGVSGSDNSTLAKIHRGVNAMRSSTRYRGYFDRAGDILSVPELTLASPLLNTNSTAQLRSGFNDAAYERLPQMIMGLLRGNDQPRFTIYTVGQTLQPAPRSRVMTSGQFFNLCTNYQITAEFATRTVVRIEGAPNTPKAVIESFNILGPE